MIIPLTKGYTSLVDDDQQEIASVNWRYDNGYARRRVKVAPGIWQDIHMHRLITNCPAGKVTDHINGNTLDNRRSNLRICSIGQNVRSRHKTRGASRFKGVYPRHDGKKWAAQITVDYKNIRLGDFATEEEAALAYNKAAQKYFGEYARLN